MNSTTIAWIWGIIIAIVLIGGGYWLWSSSSAPSASVTVTATTTASSDQTAPTTADSGATSTQASATATVSLSQPKTVSVSYDGSKFSPSSVTIKKGDTVRFVSTAPMWLASDPHPVHSGYDGTTRTQHCAPGYAGAKPFDECGTGTNFEFTFEKAGSWGYHDHLNDGAHGTVIVQ